MLANTTSPAPKYYSTGPAPIYAHWKDVFTVYLRACPRIPVFKSRINRFHKKPEARLTITRPGADNFAGREVQGRAATVLQETQDIAVWKALTIQQGEGIQQPLLTKQTSLSAALDKPVGCKAADPGQADLFDKVRDEYLRYYTERGSERKELGTAGSSTQSTTA